MKAYGALICVLLVIRYSSATFHELAGILPHPRVLRQAGRSDIKRCSNVLFQSQCSTTGFAQDIINRLSQCGDIGAASATGIEGVCRKNPSTEDYCGSSLVDRLGSILAIQQNCSSLCSSECRTQLRSLLNEVGCCATSNPAISLSLSSYLSFCGLTLPAACPPSSLTVPSPSGSCSVDEIVEIPVGFSCSRSNIEPILNALNSANCRDFASDFKTQCGYRNGQYCYELFLQTSTVNALASAISTCTSTSTCSNNCGTQIQSLNRDLGCCINSVNESLRIDSSGALATYRTVTNYELWSACGEVPPGECEVRLSAAASLYSNMSTILLLACAMIFLIKFW